MTDESRFASESEYLECVGVVVNAATLLDAMMADVLSVLLTCEVDVGEAIFFTLDALPAKKRLLERVATVVCSEDEKPLVSLLIEGAELVNNGGNFLHRRIVLGFAARTAELSKVFNRHSVPPLAVKAFDEIGERLID